MTSISNYEIMIDIIYPSQVRTKQMSSLKDRQDRIWKLLSIRKMNDSYDDLWYIEWQNDSFHLSYSFDLSEIYSRQRDTIIQDILEMEKKKKTIWQIERVQVESS